MIISGVGGESTSGDVHDVVTVNIMTTKGLHSINALIMDTVITRSMNLQPLSSEDYEIVQAQCGDVPHLTQSTILSPDLLIGITDTQRILADSKTTTLPSGYMLTQSILGPIITGQPNSNRSISHHSTLDQSILTSLITDVPFDKRVEQYLSVDEAGREYSITEAEARLESNHKVENHFHETVEKIDGHYQVQYFIKPESVNLPTNYELACSRLRSTIHSLSKNVTHLEFYNSIINDQLTAGMIEEAYHPSDQQCHYLAHQAILRLDKPTTPLRIVYDASAKLKGKSCLNDVISQEMYSLSKSLFDEMHMNLRDYASNSIPFIQSVLESDRAVGDQKLLGINWNPSKDVLSIRIPSLPRHCTETKRSMLSSNASIFDPMGWLQPLILQSKLLVQLWCHELKWDQPVDTSIQSKFHELLNDIESFNLEIPRYNSMSSSNEIHLVAFADASKLAMGAVIYPNLLVCSSLMHTKECSMLVQRMY
ncbi:hypothetical protein PRIPAC_79551 [Pristionchus pacificus]|uniref:Uncharacterized protein n=1 Tax=Pristionchus pacificus TaxID=54126 RepID=A0A2A6CNY1_PRIPA|nr:hypothetical protein PRIPAC_79551 [Pristionchus pacificus]|eukprot:PDM79787.1 hypothetical protein PRIPAC_32366 [Pristionchus pacificus]